MKATYARIEGFTASVRVPFLISGTQLCCPLPPYSTILGLLGCCAGREVAPEEVRVGFQYSCDNETIDPVERTVRLGMDAKGRLGTVKERGIGQRGFHVDPAIDLFVVGENTFDWLMHPAGVPCLGRSQDVVWIKDVRQVELSPIESGWLNGTWLPFSTDVPPGRILRMVEYYRNDAFHCVRIPGPSTLFVAISDSKSGVKVTYKNLYHTESRGIDYDIYLHQWSSGEV